MITGVGLTLFAVRSLEFELVSGTNQFDTLFTKFTFQIFPVVATLGVVLLIVNGPHDVCGREPPLIVLLVPNGPYFTVIEKTDRLFAHVFGKLRFLV